MTPFPGFSPAELTDRKAEWTAREIAQQPAMWRDLQTALDARQCQIERFLRPLLDRPGLRIVLTGAGTSSFGGQILAPFLARTIKRRVEAVATTDIVSNPRDAFPRDEPVLLVSFARSGSSPESVASTQIADALLTDCHHLIVTCNSEGELYKTHSARNDSLVLLMPEGSNDRAFAMTSSFTSMTLATLLALTGRTGDAAFVQKLSRAAQVILDKEASGIRTFADKGFERIVYLGSGPLKGLAQESALKLLELTAGGIVSYFDTPLGFRHGPKSIIDDKTMLVVFLSNDPHTRAYDLDLLDELRRGANNGGVIAVSASRDARTDAGEVWPLEGLAGLDDTEMAIAAVVFAQILAMHVSLALGRTPDNPFPSGEVNRVVQGVTIHELSPASAR